MWVVIWQLYEAFVLGLTPEQESLRLIKFEVYLFNYTYHQQTCITTLIFLQPIGTKRLETNWLRNKLSQVRDLKPLIYMICMGLSV
jgi:hypothetical protein